MTPDDESDIKADIIVDPGIDWKMPEELLDANGRNAEEQIEKVREAVYYHQDTARLWLEHVATLLREYDRVRGELMRERLAK